jgi:hypothetical protein
MRTITNQDRADNAANMLALYGDIRNPEEPITDVLTDLMHYCHLEELDFSICLQNAQWNFNEELKEESK